MLENPSNNDGVFCNQAADILRYWVRNKVPLLDPLNPVFLAAVKLHFKIAWWNFTTMVYKIRVLHCIDHRLELLRARSFLQVSYGFLSNITDAFKFVIKPKLQCFVHSSKRTFGKKRNKRWMIIQWWKLCAGTEMQSGPCRGEIVNTTKDGLNCILEYQRES